MQKVLKRIVSVLFTLILVSSIGAVCASAYSVPAESKTAVLKSNEHYSYSETVVGTFKYIGAQTNKKSDHPMTACSRYFDASSNSWKYDLKIKVKADNYIEMKKTTRFDEEVSWQLYLKPYGAWNSGAQGEGYIWHV